MSIDTVSNRNPAADLAAATEAAQNLTLGDKSLGAQDFLELLTVQMTNQDPLEPMDNTEFIAQMAQFTSLEQMNALTAGFSDYTRSAENLSASNLLGKSVTLDDPQLGPISGTVEGLEMVEGVVHLRVGGQLFGLDRLTHVSLP